MDTNNKIRLLSEKLKLSSKLLSAMGDETRQRLILDMLKMGKCEGVRVGEITEKTNLSRPAVSHHLQIMKKSGLLKLRKEGTKNYYYFEPDKKAFDCLIEALQIALEISEETPRKNYDE